MSKSFKFDKKELKSYQLQNMHNANHGDKRKQNEIEETRKFDWREEIGRNALDPQ